MLGGVVESTIALCTPIGITCECFTVYILWFRQLTSHFVCSHRISFIALSALSRCLSIGLAVGVHGHALVDVIFSTVVHSGNTLDTAGAIGTELHAVLVRVTFLFNLRIRTRVIARCPIR